MRTARGSHRQGAAKLGPILAQAVLSLVVLSCVCMIISSIINSVCVCVCVCIVISGIMIIGITRISYITVGNITSSIICMIISDYYQYHHQ